MTDYKKQVDELLALTAQEGASDLHLSPGVRPTLRISGRLTPLTDRPILDAETLEGLIFALIGEHKSRFLSEKEVDFSYVLDGGARFRANAYQTMGFYSATCRYIPPQISTIEELKLPSVIEIFTKLSQGFVLVVGPNGHGKSTTLASMIELINKERTAKIMTIEDPIEYIFSNKRSIVDQRELYRDTLSFHRAVRSTFRQNIDVLMVGEMRDLETVSATVTAAETGHLVFASLHTNSASQTIERIIDSFPPVQQSQIIIQLANTVSGIISQRLIPGLRGGLVPAVEVLIINAAVRNLIRENRIRQIDLVIETSQEAGMISLNRSLADLVKRKEISMKQAQFHSLNPKELEQLL